MMDMFERFTKRARHAVVLAQEEARRLGHDYIGPEHVLLGLLGVPDGVAARALQHIGVSLTATRTGIESLVARGSASVTGHIPFTAASKKVLELSLREALQLGHNYIGTEHVLLGLVRSGDGPAAQVLEDQAGSLTAVREAVLAEISRTGTGETGSSSRSGRTPAAEAVISTAQALAGGAPVGSHHLLEAMVLLEGSLAGNTLAALGVDADALAAKIDELGIDGTTDVTPEDAAARQMEIHVDDSEVRIVLRDAASREIARALTDTMGNPIRGDDPAGSALIELWQAVTTALQQLRGRIDRTDETDDAEGLTAIVRDAIRSRLSRRRR